MKTLKTIAFLVVIFTTFNASAQTNKATTIKIVEDKNFIFVATSATPLNTSDISNVMSKMSGNINTGGTINLNGSSYDLAITKDSVVAFLPYYGRSFSAPIDRDDAGFKFTSKKFTYDSIKNKKGGWNITINTKDVKDNVRMNLSVSASGYATLGIFSNNKQSINYNGYLSEAKKDKEKSK